LSETATCEPTQSLQPVTTWWSPREHWEAGSYRGQDNAAIVIKLPNSFQTPLNFSIQTPPFKVTLENETVQPIVGGWWNCNAGIYPAGHVFFEIHGVDKYGNDQVIDQIPVSNLGMPPSCLQEYGVSNYDHFYFKIRAVNAHFTGPSGIPAYWGYCAAVIVPKGFIARGTLPPPSQTVNIQVYVYDVSSMAPIPNATVTITDYYGYVNKQGTTGSNGVAFFEKVPFSTADTYFFSATASHYKSGGAKYTGQQIVENNYNIMIGLTSEKPTVLSTVESFAKVAGVALIAVGVAAAGLAVYKTLKERGK